jgi:hypothetical protein
MYGMCEQERANRDEGANPEQGAAWAFRPVVSLWFNGYRVDFFFNKRRPGFHPPLRVSCRTVVWVSKQFSPHSSQAARDTVCRPSLLKLKVDKRLYLLQREQENGGEKYPNNPTTKAVTECVARPTS